MFFRDPTEELQECIEIIKEDLDCEMCANWTNKDQALITTIRVCLKCRRSFMKSNHTHLLIIIFSYKTYGIQMEY